MQIKSEVWRSLQRDGHQTSQTPAKQQFIHNNVVKFRSCDLQMRLVKKKNRAPTSNKQTNGNTTTQQAWLPEDRTPLLIPSRKLNHHVTSSFSKTE
jgi:hypothetical protein